MKTSPIRRIHQSLVAAVTLWGVISVMAEDNKGKEAEPQDKEVTFIKEAAKGSQVEVELGKMASEKAQNAEVKQFAQHLVKDHTQANQELTRIAQDHGVMLQTEIAKPNLPPKDEDAADKLEDKTGAEFDKAFIQLAIKNHQKDITKYETALQECRDPKLKAFIKRNLPALRHHLELATVAGRSVGVDQSVLSSADQFLKQAQSSRSEGLGAAPASESGQGSTTRQPEHQQRKDESQAEDQRDN